MPLTFERDDSPDRPEPARSYAAGPEEPPDLRGYWLASVEAMPGLAMRTALRIGRLPDGSFEALLDRFDHGLRDAPAKSVQLTNGGAKLEWEFLHATLNARLSTNGSELTGTWAEGPRDIPVTFRRLPRPGTIVPEDTSFTPEAGRPADLRGEWRGTLDAGGTRLRIVLKTGRLPDGSLVATLTSPDQGNGEFLASSVGQTPPAVKAEWKALRAVFNATLAGDGHELSGTWEQGGRPLPLRLTRVPATSPEPAKPAQP